MIHKFRLLGCNVVLDVASGSVHLVDDLTFKILDYIRLPVAENCPDEVFAALQGFEKSEIDKRYLEIKELNRRESLFCEEEDYRKYESLIETAAIKALCLHVAHDCNLRCAYCFASTGDFGKGRKLMDFETAKRAIDFLVSKSGSRRNLEVDFFGGEPLMNFGVVKKVVEYSRSLEKSFNKNFRFTLTTNGMLLNDGVADYLNEEMSNVILSLDGREQVNNRMRKTENGKGSYGYVVENFVKFAKKRGKRDYFVRGTFTKFNLDFVEDVMHLYELGFENISVEPVVCDAAEPYAITEEDLPGIFEQYELLANKIVGLKKSGRNIKFFHFKVDLDNGPCLIKRLRGCGCGSEYVAISPEGEIYPCHQFVGMEEWKMGNVNDENCTLNSKLREKFLKSNMLTKKECSNCWAKFYCGGGCCANNQKYENNLLKPSKIYCELEKKRVECAIAVKAALI